MRAVRLGAVAVLLLAAGCHSSSKPSAAPTTTTAPASTSTSSSAATTATPTTAAGPGRCHTSQLQARIDNTQGAAGTIFLSIKLANTGTSTCTMQGYPGIGLRDASGHALGDPTRDPQLPGNAHIALVSVAPGQAGTFALALSDVQSGPGACPSVATILVTPPDETTSLTVTPASPPMDCNNPRVGPVTS